jgi:hypothetical protein
LSVAIRDDHFREGDWCRWQTHGHRSTRPSLLYAAHARQLVRRTHRGPHSNYPACRLWMCSTDTPRRNTPRHGKPTVWKEAGLPCAVEAIADRRLLCRLFWDLGDAGCNLCACARVGALFTGEECDVGAVLLHHTMGPANPSTNAKYVPFVVQCVSFAPRGLEGLIAGGSLVDVFPS